MSAYSDLLNEALNLPLDTPDSVLDAKVREAVAARVALESPSIRDTPSRRAELFTQERRTLVKERANRVFQTPAPAPEASETPAPKAK